MARRRRFGVRVGTRAARWTPGLTVVALALASTDAHAFRIYNETNRTITATVSGGTFSESIAPRASDGCSYKEKRCNSSQLPTTPRGAVVEIGSFACRVRMLAGGSVKVEAYSRKYAGLVVAGPPEYRCTSRFKPSGGALQITDTEPRFVGASTRDVRFLVTADPQYNNEFSQFEGVSQRANVTLATVNGLLRGGSMRGAVIAGDLTQNSRPIDEYKWYRFAIDGLGSTTPDPHYLTSHDIYYRPKPGGINRLYFDTVGNHDRAEPDGVQRSGCNVDPPLSYCVDPDAISDEIRTRKRVTPIAKSGVDYGSGLYSWDWHDVHFVNAGVFAGNAKSASLAHPPSSSPCAVRFQPPFGICRVELHGPAPGRALDFLRDDLRDSVGGSGRPVVIVQHYGFDGLSTGRSCNEIFQETSTGVKVSYRPPTCVRGVWWDDAQREALWDVLAPYNVAAIYTGHLHLDDAAGSSWRRPFSRPAGKSSGPGEIHTYISGAALNGIYLDVRIADNAGCNPGPGQTCLVTSRYVTSLPGVSTLLDSESVKITAR